MLAITRMAIAPEISAALGLVVRPTFLPSPSRRSLCARQCSLFGEIPPSCDSDHRRGVGPVRG